MESTKICEHCGREFSRPPWVSKPNWPKRRFCTNDCYLAAVQRPATCPICGETFQRRFGGQVTCRKQECQDAYRKTVSGPAQGVRMRADYAAGKRKRAAGISPREVALSPILMPLGWLWRLAWSDSWGSFELDFALLDRKLNVEIDGIEHRQPRRGTLDEARDAELVRRGWRILRISNEDVDASPEAVAARIAEWAAAG